VSVVCSMVSGGGGLLWELWCPVLQVHIRRPRVLGYGSGVLGSVLLNCCDGLGPDVICCGSTFSSEKDRFVRRSVDTEGVCLRWVWVQWGVGADDVGSVVLREVVLDGCVCKRDYGGGWVRGDDR